MYVVRDANELWSVNLSGETLGVTDFGFSGSFRLMTKYERKIYIYIYKINFIKINFSFSSKIKLMQKSNVPCQIIQICTIFLLASNKNC